MNAGVTGRTLQAHGTPVTDVYFRNGGVFSVTNQMRDGVLVEVATVGSEGMLGIGVAHANLLQIMQGTACNALHGVRQRCCRWLLQTQDRVGSREFLLKQEFVVIMLGVHRSTVTVVMGTLQRSGLITTRYGRIRVLNRRKLERAACECYEVIRPTSSGSDCNERRAHRHQTARVESLRSRQSVAQDHAQERVVDLQAAVVLDESELPKLVHEEVHARTRRAHHLGKRFLRHSRERPMGGFGLTVARQQQQRAGQALLARVEQLIDEVFFDADISRQHVTQKTIRESRLSMKLAHHFRFLDHSASDSCRSVRWVKAS